MSRATRLLALLQELRRHHRAVPGQALAATLGISLRTLYRDIDALRAQGAAIDGGAGIGFTLAEGFLLPPLMFSPDEVDALLLGARWVAEAGDEALRLAAGQAIAKIGAVLPAARAREMAETGLMIGPSKSVTSAPDGLVDAIRQAMRGETKLAITYRDREGAPTRRIVWPLGIGYFDQVRMMVAWCELRNDFRSFRIDRIADLAATAQRCPKRRAVLLRQWQVREGIGRP